MRTVTFIIILLMSQNVSAGLFLYLQNVAASIFSDFQSAITSVGESLGKLVTDVVSDVKDTVDCTIMAVERVLAIGGIMENNPKYDERCKPVDNTTTIKAPPDIKNTDSSETIQVIVTNPPVIENIEENVTNINMSISNVDRNTDGVDIEKAHEALRNRTRHLKEISALLKQRFEKLSEDMKNTVEKKLENDTIALIREIWKELSIVTDLKKKTNNTSEDNSLNEVLDQVLGLFKVKENPNESLKDKMEALRDDLQKEANITLSEVHYPENELRSDKKIDGNLNFLETTTDHNMTQNNSSYQNEEDRPLALRARNVLDNEYPDYSEIAEEKKRYNDNYDSDFDEPFAVPINEDKHHNNEIPSSIPSTNDNFYNKPEPVTKYGYDQTLIDSTTPPNVLYTNGVLENNLISTSIQPENIATTTPKLVPIYDYVISTTSRPMSNQLMNMTPENSKASSMDNPSMNTTKYDELILTTTANPIEAQTTTEILEMMLTTSPVIEYSKNAESNITSSSLLTPSEMQTTESFSDNITVTTTMPTNSVTLTDSQNNNITTLLTVIDSAIGFTPGNPNVTTLSPKDSANESFPTTKIGIIKNSFTLDADATTLLPDFVITTTMMNDVIQENVQDYLATTPVVSNDAKVSTFLSENAVLTPKSKKSDETTPIPTIVDTTLFTHDKVTTEIINYTTEIPSVTVGAPTATNNYVTTTELSNETLEPNDMTATESIYVQTTTDDVLITTTLEATTAIPVLTTISPYFDDFTLSPDYYSMFDLPEGDEAKKLVAEAQDLMKQQFASAKLMNAVNDAKSYDNAKSIFDNSFTGNDDTNNNDYYDDTYNDNS